MSTEKKIQKGKLIEKYIGEGIASFKFTYQGRRGDSWIFEKEFKGVIQTISLYEYRFEKNMISFDLYTDVPGKGIVQAVGIEGIEFNSEMPGFWKYEDEESFIEILKVINNIVIKKGMRILNQLSKRPEIIETNEMYQELYFKHSELAEKYQNEMGLKVGEFDENYIEEWFEIIKKRVEILQKGKFEDAKEEIVEIAAFLGEQIRNALGGEWGRYIDQKSKFESCFLENVRSKGHSNVNILKNIMGGYSSNGMDWTKKIVLEIYKERVDVEKIEKLIAALEKKEGERVKALFSEEIIEQVKEIDEQIEKLLEYCEGKILEWKWNVSGSGIGQSNEGRNYWMVRDYYEIKTEQNMYKLELIRTLSEKNRKCNGVYRIEIKSVRHKRQKSVCVGADYTPMPLGLSIDIE